MLRGRPHDETVQGFQLHAAPGHQIVMQGGEAARRNGLRHGQGVVLGGLRHGTAIRFGHGAYLGNQAAKGCLGKICGADLPDRLPRRAVRPTCAQMKASLAHSTVLMLADNSASNPACSHQATRRRARWLTRPSRSPNVVLPGPPPCTITPGSAIRAKM